MFKKTEQSASVDDLIASVVSEMNDYGPDSPEYPELLAKLERLTEVKQKTARPKVTPDGIIAGVANLAAVAVIVIVERNGVFTSKAQQLFARPR